MPLKETIQLINQMKADGVISEYAIGGAVGATFYTEPATTFDLDIFLLLPMTGSAGLLTLAPIYEYASKKKWQTDAEHVVIGDWPVQFLPAGAPLEKEALESAIPADVEGVKTRVISPEHLVALALQTGRPKDKLRIAQLLEAGAVDEVRLNTVLEHHRLSAKWDNLRRNL